MSDVTATAADIEIEVPLRFDRAATVRVVAASLAADAGFTVDEIDDLRLAISEVFSLLVEAAPGERVRIRFDIAHDGASDRADQGTGAEVSVSIARVGGGDGVTDIELDDLAASILGAVLDEFSVDGSSVHLLKRATESAH